MPKAIGRRTFFHIRQYHRIPVHCSMYFSGDQLYGTGTVWNVSIGGWRVDSDMTVEPGTALTLYIMLPVGLPPV